MKRLPHSALLAVLIFVLIPIAHSLEINIYTYPGVAHPGDNVKVIISMVGHARNVEVKVSDDYFDPWGIWWDLDDVEGSSTSFITVHVPDDANPGLYFVPLLFRYDEGNETVYQRTLLQLSVATGGISVRIKGDLRPNIKTTVVLSIKNGSDPLHSAYVSLYPSLDPPKYVGDVGNVNVEFNVIPTCSKGIEEFNVVISSIDGEKRFTLPVLCRSAKPFTVRTDLPPIIPPGRHEVNIYVVNGGDLPRVVKVVIASSVRSGGKINTVVSLDGRGSARLPLVLDVPEDVESIRLDVSVIEGNIIYSWSFSSLVAREPEIVAYLKDVKTKGSRTVAIVGVANVGDGEAKNVVVTWRGGMEFVGNLSSGDYDSVDIPLEGNRIDLTVLYSYLGKKVEKRFNLPVEVKQRGNSVPLVAITLVLILVALYWVRRRAGASNAGSQEP